MSTRLAVGVGLLAGAGLVLWLSTRAGQREASPGRAERSQSAASSSSAAVLDGIEAAPERTTVLTEQRATEADAEPGTVRVEGQLVSDYPADRLPPLTLAFVRESEGEDDVSGRRARIEPSGSWSVDLPLGSWRVWAVATECDQPIDVWPARLDVSGATEVDLRLDSSRLLDGIVVDCAGNGVPDLVVVVQECTTTTDSRGMFLSPVRRKNRELDIQVVEASLPPHLGLPWWQRPAHEVVGASPAFNVLGRARVALTSRQPVIGVALDARGAPVARRRLSIRGHFRDDVAWAEGPNYVVGTDDEGAFSVDSMAGGRYEARLYDVSVKPDPVFFHVDCAPAAGELVLRFDQGLGTSVLAGTVTDSRGTPVPGLGFGVWRKQPGLTYGSRLYFHAKTSLRSDHNGRVRAEGLPAGEYLIARTQSRRPDPTMLYLDHDRSLEVKVSDGDMAEFEWIVDTVGGATLLVTLDEGPWTGQRGAALLLEVLSAQNEPVQQRLAFPKEGALEVRDLPPGRALLSVATWSEEGEVRWNVTPAQAELVPGETIDITLRGRP